MKMLDCLHRLSIAVVAAMTVAALPAAAADAACKAEDFGMAVDEAGASLRSYNLEASPKLQARIKALATKKGWPETEVEDRAITELQDDKIAKLDETSNTLLAKIDQLGRIDPGQPVDCAKLPELKAAGIELLAVMKTKNNYLVSKIDAQIKPGETAQASPPPAPAAKAEQAPKAETAAKSEPQPSKPQVAQAAAPAAKPAEKSAPAWSATTQTAPAQPPPGPVAMVPAPPLPPEGDPSVPRPSVAMAPPPPGVLQKDEGYTIDEIRDATRGFFGTVSTGLAAVLEHAFKNSGRPTGYILGQEGGGAFLGGLRYGDGTLYVRSGGTQKIYWHGPTVGFDFGAHGARTMFLVYKMKDPADLMRTFTGVDGSAFVVGGVGITLLSGGGMILAPIRSGIGMRVGANVGYIRFTPKQTWNPF